MRGEFGERTRHPKLQLRSPTIPLLHNLRGLHTRLDWRLGGVKEASRGVRRRLGINPRRRGHVSPASIVVAQIIGQRIVNIFQKTKICGATIANHLHIGATSVDSILLTVEWESSRLQAEVADAVVERGEEEGVEGVGALVWKDLMGARPT